MQFDHYMREQDPVTTVPTLTADERQAIATRAIADANKAERRRRRPARWIAAAAALAIVATMFGLQAMTTAETASAQEILRQAAINAQDDPAAPGQYWEITSSGTGTVHAYDPPDRLYRVSVNRVDWVAVDGTRPSWSAVEDHVLLDQVAGPPMEYELVEKQRVGAVWTTNIAPADVDPGIVWAASAGDFGISPTWLNSLPTQADALAAEVRRNMSADDDPTLFQEVARILTSHLADAELRKALFGVLQSMPGIVVSEADVTLDGRTGVGLTLDDQPNWGIELIIDPDRGEVIGHREYQKAGYIDGEPVVLTELAISKRLVDDVPADIREQAVLLNCEIFDEGAGASCEPEE